MPKDPPIELTGIATIGPAFASLSVNKVFGLDEAAVAAEAMGGRIGTYLSVRRQERRAYLIEPAGGCGERITQLRSIAWVNAHRQADLIRSLSRIPVIAGGYPVPAANAELVLGSKALRDRLNKFNRDVTFGDGTSFLGGDFSLRLNQGVISIVLGGVELLTQVQ